MILVNENYQFIAEKRQAERRKTDRDFLVAFVFTVLISVFASFCAGYYVAANEAARRVREADYVASNR